jgi:hypothetical protein
LPPLSGPWWCKQQTPLKRRKTYTKLHGATSQKTAIFRPILDIHDVLWPGSVPSSLVISTGWSKCHAAHIKIYIDGCNSIQFDWINTHTISLWQNKSPRRSRHVVTCSRQSVSCLSTVEVQGCLFHKCNGCSLSNTTWHLVLT